jgi:hypothetical protein
MVTGLGLLMVSKIRYDTLPRVSKRAIKKEPWKFVFASLAVIVVLITSGNAMFPLFVLFIVLGIIRTLIDWVRRLGKRHVRFEAEEDEEEEEEEAPEPTST